MGCREDVVAGDQGATARVSPRVIPEVLEGDLEEGAEGHVSAPREPYPHPHLPPLQQCAHLPGPAVGPGIVSSHHSG